MAPPTMKAAICKELGKPLIIEQIPTPTPNARDLLVRVKVATVCHSDTALIDTGLGMATFPLIPGHEAISVVEDLGPDAAAHGFKKGDLVGAPAWHNICFSCRECVEIGPSFCTRKLVKGVSCEGYFAEYTLVDAATAVVVPGGAGVEDAARLSPLFCAGVTVWDALRRAQLQPGEALGVVGIGGLGRLRPLDVVVVTVGAVPAYQSALAMVRPEGRVIAVGIPEQDVPVSMALVATQALKVIGGRVPDQVDCARCVDFSFRKGIFPRVNPRQFQLEDINEMLDLMRAGKVEDGRMAIRFF
ncbi:hypothetical protein N7470_003269 [Penicillium chermesinum]|nr:hypothetical protein N7470_003269 [Penicillium chermesinum]